MKFFMQQGLLLLLTVSCYNVLAQESCTLPNGEPGQCVELKKCKTLFRHFLEHRENLSPLFVDLLKKLRCNPHTAQQICCGPDQMAIDDDDTSMGITTTVANDESVTDVSSDYESSLNPKGLQILDAQNCGNSSDFRVAFGSEVPLGEFAWMALLRYNTTEQPFQCGGSLITERYVLTAAHCVVHTVDAVIGVRLGEHDISTEEDCQRRGPEIICSPPAEDYGIEKMMAHPEFSYAYMKNDVALLKLDRDVEFKSHIRPICLPITPLSLVRNADQRYVIAGWGTTELGVESNVLLMAQIPSQKRRYCQNIYKRARITDNHICAGGVVPEDSCKGDSGGPLFVKTTYREHIVRYVQYGVVSFGGIHCGATLKTNPSIYANVITQMPWITNNID